MTLQEILQRFIDYISLRTQPENLVNTLAFLLIVAAIAYIPVIGVPLVLLITAYIVLTILK